MSKRKKSRSRNEVESAHLREGKSGDENGVGASKTANAGKVEEQKRLLDTVEPSSSGLNAVVCALLSLPILVFGLRVIATGDLLGIEDWDWFFSHYEALRRSIVEYGQFPWWNPWSTGGTPLFADPQVGLISIQTPLVLLFGTVMGLKIGFVAYLLAGFWGMYFLLGLLSDEFWRKVLLSYLWISSTFVMFHYTAGHYTFLLYLLVPWLVYFYLWKIPLHGENRRGWLVRFSLFAGFFVHSAPHYIAVQTVVWMVGLFLVLVIRNRHCLKSLLNSHLAAVLLILPLIAPKILFALEYLGDFPREPLINSSLGVVDGIKAFVLPGQAYRFESWIPAISSWEISAYIGLLTILVFIGLLIWQARNFLIGRETTDPLFLAFSSCAAIAFLIGLGPFASVTPWSLISSLPILENMQVPTRWFGWSIFFIVLAIGSVRMFPKWLLVPLAISLVEVTAFNTIRPQPFVVPLQQSPLPAPEIFEQFEVYPHAVENQNSNMFASMHYNFGEVRAYEPILGYEYLIRQTARKGIDEGHHLLTDNAKLIEWSPNRIRYQRTGPGEMILNANVGRWWTLNDEYMFQQMRVTETTLAFGLGEEAPHEITLECRPQRAWTLYLPLLTLAGYLLIALRGLSAKRSLE